MDANGHQCLAAGPTISRRVYFVIMNSECIKTTALAAAAVVIATRDAENIVRKLAGIKGKKNRRDNGHKEG
jgi:hypothetical protein